MIEFEEEDGVEAQSSEILRNCIKVRNLPPKYNPREVLAMFDRVSRIVKYSLFEEELWIRFKGIENRRACLFMQGVQVGDRRITVDLEFSEGDLLQMKQSKLGTASLYFTKEQVQAVRTTHSKEFMHSKIDVAAQDYTEALMRYLFSRRYFNLLMLLYAAWKLVDWLAD